MFATLARVPSAGSSYVHKSSLPVISAHWCCATHTSCHEAPSVPGTSCMLPPLCSHGFDPHRQPSCLGRGDDQNGHGGGQTGRPQSGAAQNGARLGSSDKRWKPRNQQCPTAARPQEPAEALQLVSTVRMFMESATNSCGFRTHALTNWRLKPAP